MHEATLVRNYFNVESFYEALDRILSKEHDFEGESHNFWEIVYVDDGEVEVTEEGNVYNLSEGDMIFHAPMEFHRIKSYANTTPNLFNLSFWSNGDYPQELLSGIFHLDGVERKEFLAICENARQLIEGEIENKFFGQEVADRLTTFMLRLSRTYQSQQKKIPTERVRTYRRLVEIMHEEVFNNISIAQVAEKMFISVSYVKVLFNRYAGVSPKNYYTNLQVNEAAKMLAEGKSVREIAEQMSFSTPSYFSVFFKKHMGMTPKQYKNMKK